MVDLTQFDYNFLFGYSQTQSSKLLTRFFVLPLVDVEQNNNKKFRIRHGQIPLPKKCRSVRCNHEEDVEAFDVDKTIGTRLFLWFIF